MTVNDPRKLGNGGFFRYTADDRRAAGSTLFQIIFDRVHAEAGWLGEALTDASDATANQVCNCFARDACDINEDNDNWKSPGIGATVSPQDLTEYSLFGALEPLAYRSGGSGRYYAWANAQGTSTLHVAVVQDPTNGGNPVPYAGARVTVPSLNGTQEGTSDQNGEVTFDGVPQGSATVQAESMISGLDWTGSSDVTVGSTDTSVTVVLLRPDVFRIMNVSAYITEHHEQEFWSGDGSNTCTGQKYLNPFARTDSWSCHADAGDGTAQVNLNFTLQDDNTTIRVDATYCELDDGAVQNSYSSYPPYNPLFLAKDTCSGYGIDLPWTHGLKIPGDTFNDKGHWDMSFCNNTQR